ncbi:DUF2780 domain-containing protein [Skermanella mucosa]|uniref:DUF2780 domain-containing protein n=1 Tax=Skermanella mucosa TaxID=1789672 RepID=UPI00192B7A61|nr:DUF2780 domain-containing protein [Skermanella mucosa]UEM22054.1 DUF2780 domain-containing protein [Skermanella mucosa]
MRQFLSSRVLSSRVLSSRILLLATALMFAVATGMPRAAQAADAGGLVNALTSQLGVSKPQAEGGAGALFNLAKQRMNSDQFGQVESQVPGIGGLMGAAPGGSNGSGSASGGSGGGLAGMASGALGGMSGGSGGGLGALAPLAGSFSSLGLSPDMATKFLPVVLEYLNSSGGGGAAGLLKGALTG